MQRAKKKLKIKIPAGISSGETIRLQNEGEISSDFSRHGDLYVQIEVKEYYKFTRKGDDIHSSEPIAFTTAALGGKILVDTIDGKVELKIPAGTPSGKVFKLKRKGVTHLQSYGRGDQYVKVKIVVPDRLIGNAKKLLERLREEGL
jgi:molecular chaperone DnaJ